jgi:hypothetical protein
MTIRPSQYRELVLAALPPATDNETFEVTRRTLYTPESHRSALDPDVTLVRGARGVGKSVWFGALLDEEQRKLVADSFRFARLARVTPHPGFGLRLSPHYPSESGLAALMAAGHDPDHIWSAVLVEALTRSSGSWNDKVERVRTDPQVVDAALSAADRRAAGLDITHLLVFDALDRLHADRSTNDRLATGVLKLGLRLRTTVRNVRAKAFVRPDMADRVLRDFRDASKLEANAASLSWTPMSLYALLFQWLGNSDHPHAKAFRKETNNDREWSSAAGRVTVPDRLGSDRGLQQKVVDAITGPHMGPNPKRGATYTWLPNHLMDGNHQASPRSFLSAVRHAAAESADHHGDHSHALHWEAIKVGVQHASRIRVREITEDLPWVSALIQPLAGQQVPIEQSAVVAIWDAEGTAARLAEPPPPTGDAQGEVSVRTGPRSLDPADLVDELIEIGVMTRRADGRLDLPDVYRVAFGLGRKGGVRRVSR